MAVPCLKAEDVEIIIPNCKVLGKAMCGGQKKVFPCEINGEKFALKFILLRNLAVDDETEEVDLSEFEEIRARAEREISIMKSVSSHNVIKIGNIDLTGIEYNNQNILYYSEEWIDGEDISTILRRNVTMCNLDVLHLGIDIAKAIDYIWETNNVHRDIKPQNIMKRDCDNSFVLLDLGMAFDLDDKSLTKMGFVPGTKIYFSPEQLDWKRKRDIDFRSDLFSLGMVMYQAITGCHPFYKAGMYDNELFSRIIGDTPISPQAIKQDISKSLNDVIMRLLSKAPNGRYRKCSFLINQLQTLLHELEV